MVRRALVILALAACHTFQDPNVVIDLRVLAIDSTVPEQVIDIDLEHAPAPDQVLSQLVPSKVCVLVADPNFDNRRLRWALTLCPPSGNDRCSDDQPNFVIGSGVEEDPDLTKPEPTICATVNPDDHLFAVLVDALENDALGGFQGLQYQVMLRIGGEGADDTLDLFAAKSLQVAARIPPARTANTNPSVTEIDAKIGDADPVPLPLGRCIDQSAPLSVKPGDKVRLTPVEPDGVHETYVIPTLDGKSEMFTETISYQWTAGNGGFSKGTSGGPHDPFGNPAPLFTDWSAPKADELNGQPLVPIWIVQRDERLGVHWYESCIRVATPSGSE